MNPRIILLLKLLNPNYQICKGCGALRKIPEEHQYKERHCKTKGCYWMLHSDGSQGTDYPGE